MFQEWKNKNVIFRTGTYRVLLGTLVKCNCLVLPFLVCGERYPYIQLGIHF